LLLSETRPQKMGIFALFSGRMPNSKACCRNAKKPPSKLGGDFLFNLWGVAKSVAARMARTQGFIVKVRNYLVCC
jgi:hypothetical protein